MNCQEIRVGVIDVLNDMGMSIDYSIDAKTNCITSDINLNEYLTDSIMFITFVVEIEKKFNIYIPDNFLSLDKFVSVNGLINILDILINNVNLENDKAVLL